MANWLQSSLQKRTWGSWWIRSWMWLNRAPWRAVKYWSRFSRKPADISVLGHIQNLTLEGPEQCQVGIAFSGTWTRCSPEVPYNLYYFVILDFNNLLVKIWNTTHLYWITKVLALSHTTSTFLHLLWLNRVVLKYSCIVSHPVQFSFQKIVFVILKARNNFVSVTLQQWKYSVPITQIFSS